MGSQQRLHQQRTTRCSMPRLHHSTVLLPPASHPLRDDFRRSQAGQHAARPVQYAGAVGGAGRRVEITFAQRAAQHNCVCTRKKEQDEQQGSVNATAASGAARAGCDAQAGAACALLQRPGHAHAAQPARHTSLPDMPAAFLARA